MLIQCCVLAGSLFSASSGYFIFQWCVGGKCINSTNAPADPMAGKCCSARCKGQREFLPVRENGLTYLESEYYFVTVVFLVKCLENQQR